MKTILLTLILLIGSTTLSSPSHAALQELPPTLQKFVTSDVVAVGFVDLEKVDATATAMWINSLGFVDEIQAGELLLGSKSMQDLLEKVTGLGAEKLYFVFRISDIGNEGPSWVVSVSDGRDASRVLEAIKPMVKDVRAPWHFENGYADSPKKPQLIEAFDGAVIGGSKQAQLDKLKASKPARRAELESAWAKIESTDCGLVIFGDADSRKVFRQMFPKLPSPFEAVTGVLLADKTKSAQFGLKFTPTGSGEFQLVTSDEQSAKVLNEAALAAVEVLKNRPSSNAFLNPFLDDEAVKSIVENIKPTLAGNKVVVDLDSLIASPQNVTDLVQPAFDQARLTQRKKNVRNMVLAMHNYESAFKSFPTNAIYSKDGKPLLSWRVALLPFIGERDLHKEFKLDEPWDSAHNIKLVAKMPKALADPDPEYAELLKAGKTMTQVPYGDKTLFHGKEEMTFRRITDGTSNTILIVEVAPENAVEWTRPSDWNVDMANPLKGLETKGKRGVVFALGDGSVHELRTKVKTEVLQMALTFEGGEVFQHSALAK